VPVEPRADAFFAALQSFAIVALVPLFLAQISLATWHATLYHAWKLHLDPAQPSPAELVEPSVNCHHCSESHSYSHIGHRQRNRPFSCKITGYKCSILLAQTPAAAV